MRGCVGWCGGWLAGWLVQSSIRIACLTVDGVGCLTWGWILISSDTSSDSSLSPMTQITSSPPHHTMSFTRHLVCLTLLVCTLAGVFTAASASAALPVVKSGSFVHTELDRTIDLKTHIEEVTVQIKAKNAGVRRTTTHPLISCE